MPQVVAFVVVYWVQIMAVAAVVAAGYAAIQARNMKMGGDSQFAQQQMVRSSNEPRRGIYGKAMVSGPLMFIGETGTDREWLYLVIAVCGHVTDGCELVKLDDQVAWKEQGGLTSKYQNHVRIKYYNGTQTAADSELVSKFNSWTNQHVGHGVSYLRIGIKSDQDVFPSGIPNIKMLIRGKRVFDPRDLTQSRENPSTWKYTDNWALCCLDYAMLESGVGATDEEIDLDSFIAAANLSDEFVEYQAEKFEKRYTLNGTWMADQTPQSIMESLLSAGSGKLVFTHGVYSLFAGAYYGPATLTLDDDGLRDDMSLTPFTERADICNAVRGTFVDPNNFWQSVDFPPVENEFYRNQDKGEYIDHDIDLEMVISPWTAQRLAKLHLEQSRAGFTVNYPAKLGIGLQCWPGRVVRLHIPRLGINKEFEVVDWSLKPDEGVDLVLKETAPEIFDWALGEATSRDITPNSDLPDPKQVPTPSGLAFAAAADNSSFLGSCTWNAPGGNSAYRYRLAVFDGMQALIYQQDIASTQCHLPKIDVGFYTVKVWAINTFGYLSNVAAEITIGSSSPANVIGIDVEAGPLSLTIKPGTAAEIAQTTVFEVVGGQNNVIEDAAIVGTGKEIVWADRHPNTTYYLWARTSNNQGKSAWFGPVQTKTSADKSAIVDLIGSTFDKYTWFAWADDNQGTGFTTVEALGDGKAYMGIATDKETASPSGNWQEYTWTKIKTEIPPVFTPEEETKLDNLMAGKLPFAPDKDMLAAQDALNNPALANNLITALSLLNQGINAPALGGETPSGAQSKASSAQSAAIAAAATDATTKANNAKAAAESYALAKANLAETTAKAYADGIVSDEEARAIADAKAKADAAKAAAIAAAAADATSKANNAKAQAEANAALDALNKATTAKTDAITTAASDATTKANNAKAAAESYALAKANLAETTAKAYADGIVSDEEARAIADAQAKADAAKAAAIAAAAADATNKANNARAQAEANAALDALNKATTAKADAISTASTDATNKIGALKIGGTNLVENSLINADSTSYGFANRVVNLVSGREYVFSAAGYVSQKALDEGHNLVIYIYKPDWSFSKALSISTLSESVKDLTFIAPSTGSYSINSYLYPSGGTRTGTVHCSWYKLEEGNKPTAWAPAPVDLENYASNQAAQAQSNATASAALDALNKANAAKADAISTASTDATTKANNAKTQAISSAATDATTKADAAKAAAIAAAAADATTKANNAKAQAEANAALDALNKATTAKADAITEALAQSGGNNLLNISTFTSNKNKGGWNTGSVELISSVPGVSPLDGRLYAFKLVTRDSYEINNIIPVKGGETLYFSAWINTQSCNYSVGFGYRKVVNGVSQSSWYGVVTLGLGNSWTWLQGSIVIPNDCTSIMPWIVINGNSGFGTGFVQDLVISRSPIKAGALAVRDSLSASEVGADPVGSAASAQSAAIAAAAADATSKANNAKAQAEANAALDALNKANTAKADAISTASTDATTKANNAKTQAISSAATDATTKANNAQSAAIAAAAADATTKANNAKAQAEANAALDAINKANAAKTDAISTAATDATAKANSALTAANAELNNRINAAEAAALDNLFSISGLPYRKDIVIGGDSNKYYPVVFWGGSQDVNRRIKIWRGYNEQAPNDWYSSTHKGQLTIDWLGNFGGWGGAGYFDQLLSHRWEYTELLGDLFRFGQFQAYCFMLRGGGAIYHFASDLNVLPEVYYNQELLHAGSNTYAPAPSTTVNSERILYAKLGNASFGNLLAYSGQFTALKSRIGNFGGLTAETIAALAIATNHLQAGSVTVDKVGANAITAEKIAALAIATNHLQAGAVTVDKVGANAITAEKIAALAIATNHLQAGAVTVDKVSANAITAEKIAALAIATNHLQAGAVTVDKVGANAITAEKIAALAIATNHLQAGSVTADKVTADTALIQKLIADVGLFNQLQSQLGIFGGLGANSIAANSITTKHLTIANTDNICTNPKFANGSNEGWTSNVTVSSTSNAAGWGSNYVGLINNYRDTYFNYGKPFNVQNGDSYFISCYAYHYLNPNSDFRLGFQVSYSDGSVNWLTFLARSASDRGDINFASGTIKTLDVSGKKIVSAMLFLQMNGTTGAMGGGYYFSNVYLRKMASSELIVDGAITTQKILSKAITTDKIAANAVTANELLADTALINKLVATSALFDSLVARLAVFGGLTANSIASDAILGRHIKAGEKITSPIIEGGEVRLIGTNAMKIESATPFGPDSLVYWRGPRLLVSGNPDWANIRKSNATRWTDVNGDEYFGGTLSAGVLKTGVTNTDKNPYLANSYPVEIGPFSTNGKAKVIVISFRLNGVSTASSSPNNPTQPQLSWQLQRKIGSGSWVTVSSGVFTGTTSAEYESEPPAHWITFEGCNGSSTYTDNTVSTSDFSYRILVVSYRRFHATANITNQSLSLISTEQ